jgi:hypothetical protein
MEPLRCRSLEKCGCVIEIRIGFCGDDGAAVGLELDV